MLSKIGLDYENSRGRTVNIICTKKEHDHGGITYVVDRKGGGFSYWSKTGSKITNTIKTAKGTRSMFVGYLNEETFIKELDSGVAV